MNLQGLPPLTEVQLESKMSTDKIYLVTQKPNFQILLTVILFLLTIAFSAGTAVVIAKSETSAHAVDTYLTKEQYFREMSRNDQDHLVLNQKMDEVLKRLPARKGNSSEVTNYGN